MSSISVLPVMEASRSSNPDTGFVNSSNISNQHVSHSNIPPQQAYDPGNISTATHTYITSSPIVASSNVNRYIPTTSVETQPLVQSSVFGNRNPQTPMFPACTTVPVCNYQPQAPVSTQLPGIILDQNINIFSEFSTQSVTDNPKHTFAGFHTLSPGPNVSDHSAFGQEQLSPCQTVPGHNISDSICLRQEQMSTFQTTRGPNVCDSFWQEQMSPLQTVPTSSFHQPCSGEQPMSTGSSNLSLIDPNVMNELLDNYLPSEYRNIVDNPADLQDFETDTNTSHPFTPKHTDPAIVTNTSQVIRGGKDKLFLSDYTDVEQAQQGHAKSSPESRSRTTEKVRYQKFPESPTHECRHCEKKKSLYIELSYLDNLVKTDHLATGCCSIIYQTADNQTADNTELIMPAWPDDIGSKKAITKANTVLQNCHFGTILETDIKGNIYVTRNCKIKIFTDTKSTPEIAREIKTLVFDFEKDFEKVLELYKSNHIKTKPKPYLMVYFGLDPSKAHPGQMLISARVTSCAALNRLLEVDDIRSQKDEASLSIQMSLMDLKK